jgi:hypothetical protein
VGAEDNEDDAWEEEEEEEDDAEEEEESKFKDSDIDTLIYCGDAAGRKYKDGSKDFSISDYYFAFNIDAIFELPEKTFKQSDLKGKIIDLYDSIELKKYITKDKLNIKQHRTHYENAIIDMSDYLDGLMLNELLSLSPASLTPQKIMNTIDNINKMSSGKQNLNKIMKYVDDN